MKNSFKIVLVISFCQFFCNSTVWSQNEKGTWLGVFVGKMNYQGDLNPSSFKFSNSNLTAGVTIRQTINRWISLRGGFTMGSIEAADRLNRDYLKPRNLSFATSIKEASLSMEASLLDLSTKRFTPYVYGSILAYHFNPWALDKDDKKVYLQPLGTEGQGLPDYPKQNPYKLTQFAVGFGGGARYAINDNMNIGVEFTQRKTFTDYLDDVSSIYVDQNTLLQARGPKAVEMAYRGAELPGGRSYPNHGEQRGTPSEMDWYYFFGINFEIKFSAFTQLFRASAENTSALHNTRCPKNVLQ